MVIPCPGFNYEKKQKQNCYNCTRNIRKKNTLNESFLIHYINGVRSTHSSEYTNGAVITRHSKHGDKHVCEKCFDFPSIQLVTDRGNTTFGENLFCRGRKQLLI